MHIYEKDGKEYPSVTTIIHSLGNDEITKWANRLGFRHIDYEKELEKSSINGTKVHDLLRGEVDSSYTPKVEYKDDLERITLLGYLTRFRNFIQDYTYETIFTEKTFISEKLGYAGTLDWLATFNDKYLVLNDFKTSRAVRFGFLLQLGGYYNLLHENGYDPDCASIILVNKKLCSMYPINKSDLLYFANTFNILAQFYLMTYHKEPIADKELLLKLKTA